MAEVRWSEEAERWLRDIHAYIASDNPEAARKVVSGIFERSQILQRFPDIGYLYRKEPEGEIRILLYGHYRIAYLVMSSNVIVLGVFHGALDIKTYLQ